MSKGSTPLKAIREKCLDCSGGSYKEVQHCPVESCALHPFRLGRNPYRKRRELTDEQRRETAKRLKQAREAKNG